LIWILFILHYTHNICQFLFKFYPALTIALLDKTGFSCVMSVSGEEVGLDAAITLTEGLIKAVRMNWRSTILVAPVEDGKGYSTLSKQRMKAY